MTDVVPGHVAVGREEIRQRRFRQQCVQRNPLSNACLGLLINWEKQHEATGGALVIDWDTLHASFRQENGSRPVIVKREVVRREVVQQEGRM